MSGLEIPRVSVLLLTYNHAPFVEHAILSAVTQGTSFPFEVVVGDDFSTTRHHASCVVWQSDSRVASGRSSARRTSACGAISGAARYVRFTSVLRPDELPGQKSQTWYRWPYYEGLRLDEAMNELAFFTVGIYGHPLPKQNGAPWRLVLPWKYGYKGPKAVVKIEFVREQPQTFWNDLQPAEYGFHSNVNPSRPHPRWSQASGRVLDTGDRIPTHLYNGYEAQVAALYPDEDPY